jgi:hypothetical protein
MATITPFVKRMRAQGGTIYTFTSALEDIGLNINERNNIVKMSHYALLNIPAIDVPSAAEINKFNVYAIPGAYQYLGANIIDGRRVVAESFQNYALNLETNLLALDSYNPALNTTVSERVFWKWLKETGAIRWAPDISAGGYWREEHLLDNSVGYSSVVKGIGQISAGSVRTDTFGTYNETYVLVPTSFGQTPVYFKQVEDDNYHHLMAIPLLMNGNTNILGRESYTQAHPDGLDIRAFYDYVSPNYYITDDSAYIPSGPYYEDISITYPLRRSRVDCMSIEFDLDNLKTILGDAALTFDSLAVEPKYVLNDNYDFNAILLYYSVYNKALDEILATNLLGILFLDYAAGNTQDFPLNQIIIPSISKLQSTTDGFGTSYSFRLNIKSDYMLDDTEATIMDESTSVQEQLGDFTEVFDGLSKNLAILNRHTGTINYITQQYLDLTSNYTDMLNHVDELQYQINDITRDITGTENAIPMFADGADPIVDSSIYMYNGKIGFFNSRPTYLVQMDVSVKVKDLILENSIVDTSNNIILSYNAPKLKLGNWTFDTSGTMLRLLYDTSVMFTFTSNGSIL